MTSPCLLTLDLFAAQVTPFRADVEFAHGMAYLTVGDVQYVTALLSAPADLSGVGV